MDKGIPFLILPFKQGTAVPEDAPHVGEGTLPTNVDVTDNKLKDPIERARVRRIFEQGLNTIVGYALPIAWDYGSEGWIASEWSFRRGKLFLIPGD